MTLAIDARQLDKTFTLHLQDGQALTVLRDVDLQVKTGECVALTGRSGSGKSTLMRSLYGNYRPTGGSIRIREGDDQVELVGAEPRVILRLRRATIGYVSQFLRVIPRVPTLRLVMEPLLALGVDEAAARERAETLLERLNLPRRLWSLPPATFSGGEQQRVNIDALLRGRLSHPAAGRADGVARPGQPAGGGRADPGGPRPGRRHRRHLPRR
jgi:alpha-D-ribose 1-methylphosphonate 5-triphosphate synthase subunit PhnL